MQAPLSTETTVSIVVDGPMRLSEVRQLQALLALAEQIAENEGVDAARIIASAMRCANHIGTWRQ